MTSFIRSHPLLLYFGLAFALFWACIGLGYLDRFHFWVPILGAVHTAWHWPVILLPHQYLSDVPLLPWSVFVLSEAIIFTWIFQNTRRSVLMATLYHWSSNLGMILYGGIDRAWAPWFKCSTSVLVALCVLTWAGPNLKREPSRPTTG